MARFGSIVMAAVSFAAALFIGIHVANAQFYRGMNRDAAAPAQPQVQNSALGLGVRAQDVIANPAGNIPPDAPQGVSVAINNPCSLPAFSRPAGAPWNGTAGPNVRVFQMNPANLPANLQLQPAPIAGPAPNPNHAVISTAGAAPLNLAAMQAAVGGTVAHWAIVNAPPAGGNCP